MSKPTTNAQDFMTANDQWRVVEGRAKLKTGGGVYTLEDGRQYDLSLEDCRSLPEGYPRWLMP